MCLRRTDIAAVQRCISSHVLYRSQLSRSLPSIAPNCGGSVFHSHNFKTHANSSKTDSCSEPHLGYKAARYHDVRIRRNSHRVTHNKPKEPTKCENAPDVSIKDKLLECVRVADDNVRTLRPFPHSFTDHERNEPPPKELPPEKRLSEDRQPSLDPPRRIQPLLDQVISHAREHRYPDVFRSAQKLVAAEGVPSLELYQVLIQACADAPGCILQDLASNLLEEMEARGLQPTQDIYYSLLKLLSKSPDYLARTQVLEKMNELWIPMNGQAWEWVILGYLCDDQLEMALDALDECIVANEKVKKGVYLALFRHIVAVGEINEALRLIKEAEIHTGKEVEGFMTSESWYNLLLAAAEDLHYEGTKTAWDVITTPPEKPLFTPHDGLRELVLNVAARHGDPVLAENTLQIGAKLGNTLREHHYAALIEAYATANQPLKTFSILEQMHLAGILTTPTTTRSAVSSLSKDNAALENAEQLLQQMAKKGTLTITAAELVIAAYIYAEDITSAVAIYRSLPELGLTPGIPTYNILLKGCAKGGDKDLAVYIIRQILSNTVEMKPDANSYGYLLDVCTKQEDHLDAFFWLEEMKAKGYRPRAKHYQNLFLKCSKLGDEERARMVLEEMEEMGYDTSPMTMRSESM